MENRNSELEILPDIEFAFVKIFAEHEQCGVSVASLFDYLTLPVSLENILFVGSILESLVKDGALEKELRFNEYDEFLDTFYFIKDNGLVQ